MKKVYLLIGLMGMLSILPFPVLAQSFDSLWKEIESLQKKDLPKSVIETVDKVYEKAQEEQNLPQLMKAYLVRAECKVQISPDSMQRELSGLKTWAVQETDTLARAVLSALMGNVMLNTDSADLDAALAYYRAALQNDKILKATPAKDFLPMTVSGELSEQCFEDNMYELLVHEAIRNLSASGNFRREEKAQLAILSLYDDLIAYYGYRNRQGCLLTKLARLAYLSFDNSVLNKYRVSDQQALSALKSLLDEYEDLDVCADVYVKIADTYGRRGELVKKMEVIQAGLKKYPDSKYSYTLKRQMGEVMSPELRVQIPFVYPGREVDVNVYYKNLSGLTLELYQLDIHPSSPLLNGNITAEVLVKAYGKKVSSQDFLLKPTTDYKPTETTLRYKMPEAGIYILKSIPKGTKEGTAYSVMYVSPYQCIAIPLENNRQELIAIDKLTGQPVANAEIVTYLPKNKAYQEDKVYKTNGQGSVIIDRSSKKPLYCNVRTPGNDFMSIAYLEGYLNFFPGNDREELRRISLFTDRSIYRPGQTVSVSGVVYKQYGDSLHVVKGEDVKLVLFGTDSQIAEKSVTSDDLGSFSAEFVIPQSVLSGNFRIETTRASCYFRVEEYKRPTFDVTFTSSDSTYRVGDTIRVEGMAKTFSGVPVRLADVSYRVVYSPMWMFRGNRSNSELMKGTLQTDAEGRFSLRVCLEKPEERNLYPGISPTCRYEIMAEVTDGAGETQQGSYTVLAGEQSLFLQINGLSDCVLKENKQKIQFLALNLNEKSIKTDVNYRVFSAGTDAVADSLLYEGKAVSQEAFVPSEIYSLPSGKYRLEVSATDALMRQVTAEQSFILFSLEDTCPPVDTVDWFYQTGEEFDTIHPVSLYLGSSEKNVYAMIDVYAYEKRIDSKRILLNNEIRKFTYPYRQEYGDGIMIHAMFMRDGKLYQHNCRIIRPEPEKQLQLKWITFRDKLRPGGQEEWRLEVRDRNGLPVQAAMLAAMYDASLDKLYSHEWNFNLNFNRNVPWISSGITYNGQNVGLFSSFTYRYAGNGLDLLNGDYSRLYPFNLRKSVYAMLQSGRVLAINDAAGLPMLKSASVAGVQRNMAAEEALVADSGTSMSGEFGLTDVANVENDGESSPENGGENVVPLRENFSETAFFYPGLRTDSTGCVSISFMMPESLTEWKFMGFAHTCEMDYGMITAKAKTSKEFMLQPNYPRFVRMGDHVVMKASLHNLSMEKVSGTARLELSEPETGKQILATDQLFSVDEGSSATVAFAFDVPDDCNLLVCKMTADGGNFSDGEQRFLPVLSDKQWITETIPVQVKGGETKNVSTDELFNRQSQTTTERRLTIEMTSNPEWYAVQALPVLGNPRSDDALAWASAFYGNRLASAIIDANSRIKELFSGWLSSGASKETLISNLEKNEDLKNILLKESPWVLEASEETEQKQRVALLFDLNTMSNRMQVAIRKLKALQLEDGSWSWYKGMAGSRDITMQIVEMFARLKSLVGINDGEVNEMYRKALSYLNETMREYVQNMRMNKDKHPKVFPERFAVEFLYIGALDEMAYRMTDKEVRDYILPLLKDRSDEYDIYEKAQIAVIMDASGENQQARDLVRSIKEYIVSDSVMGCYFDTPKAPYSWSDFRIPTQVMAMEAIKRIDRDAELLDGMKLWLLKQKQVQAWENPLSSVNAIHAFLADGKTVLQNLGTMTAKLDETEIRTPDDVLGYVRKTYSGELCDVKEISFAQAGGNTGWGAVYAQCLEEMSNVTSGRSSGLSVSREYLLDGERMKKDKTTLHVGDKLTVRLVIKADRDMDFIRVEDVKAACMEPEEQLSGYRMGYGTGYYQVNNDASTEFFIDHLRKGTHVIDYTVYIDKAGVYQAGSASVQSVYAPEFSGHSEGIELTVE